MNIDIHIIHTRGARVRVAWVRLRACVYLMCLHSCASMFTRDGGTTQAHADRMAHSAGAITSHLEERSACLHFLYPSLAVRAAQAHGIHEGGALTFRTTTRRSTGTLHG